MGDDCSYIFRQVVCMSNSIDALFAKLEFKNNKNGDDNA